MKISTNLILLSLLLPAICLSESISIKEMAACSKVDGSVERLACFDSLSKKHGGLTKKEILEPEDKGKWVIRKDTSPIDDSEKVVLFVNSETPITNKFGKTSAPTMFLRCLENKTEVYIDFDSFIGTNRISVTTRVDKEKAKKERWGASSDHNAIFARNNISFIKNMLNKDKLLIQLTPYGANTVMAEFDISGIENAIKPLRKACGW